MTLAHILESTSYSALVPAEQEELKAFFNRYLEQPIDGVSTMSFGDADNDLHTIFGDRASLLVPLNYHIKRLDEEINPVTFGYMSANNKTVLENELLLTFFKLNAQFKLDQAEGRAQKLHALSTKIFQCAALIKKLNSVGQLGPVRSEKAQLDLAIDESGKHLKYLGLTLVARSVIDKIEELMATNTHKERMDFVKASIDDAQDWQQAGKTETSKYIKSTINGFRLQWVWGNALLNSIFALLADDFAGKQQGQQALRSVSAVTGYMSWILYYARGGVELGLLLKHTIEGPWMSKAESEIPALERFLTQWNQRKFALLNDFIWGFANMACHLWLIGNGLLGYMGNVATVGLLIMDASLVAWGLHEQSTQHNVDKERYARDIERLEAKIAAADDDEQKAVLVLELAALEKESAQCDLDWRYKKYGMVKDLTYAITLLAAFVVMCCFLFPPAAIVPATAMMLGLVGSAMCFVFNTVAAAVTGALDISKLQVTSALARKNAEELLTKYSTANEVEKKLLYLDLKQALATSEDQDAVIQFQRVQLVHTILTSLMVPPLVFVALTFLPLGIGVVVIAAGLALALITSIIIKQFAPDKYSLPELNDRDYADFPSGPTPTLEDVTVHIQLDRRNQQQGFFAQSTTGQQRLLESNVPSEGVEMRMIPT